MLARVNQFGGRLGAGMKRVTFFTTSQCSYIDLILIGYWIIEQNQIYGRKLSSSKSRISFLERHRIIFVPSKMTQRRETTVVLFTKALFIDTNMIASIFTQASFSW